jgi:hypothetical protein
MSNEDRVTALVNLHKKYENLLPISTKAGGAEVKIHYEGRWLDNVDYPLGTGVVTIKGTRAWAAYKPYTEGFMPEESMTDFLRRMDPRRMADSRRFLTHTLPFDEPVEVIFTHMPNIPNDASAGWLTRRGQQAVKNAYFKHPDALQRHWDELPPMEWFNQSLSGRLDTSAVVWQPGGEGRVKFTKPLSDADVERVARGAKIVTAAGNKPQTAPLLTDYTYRLKGGGQVAEPHVIMSTKEIEDRSMQALIAEYGEPIEILNAQGEKVAEAVRLRLPGGVYTANRLTRNVAMQSIHASAHQAIARQIQTEQGLSLEMFGGSTGLRQHAMKQAEHKVTAMAAILGRLSKPTIP